MNSTPLILIFNTKKIPTSTFVFKSLQTIKHKNKTRQRKTQTTFSLCVCVVCLFHKSFRWVNLQARIRSTVVHSGRIATNSSSELLFDAIWRLKLFTLVFRRGFDLKAFKNSFSGTLWGVVQEKITKRIKEKQQRSEQKMLNRQENIMPGQAWSFCSNSTKENLKAL